MEVTPSPEKGTFLKPLIGQGFGALCSQGHMRDKLLDAPATELICVE